ncbi:FtsB family cell division protein [Clostridium brassicae]|uniref:Septum formation initiator family protein n=1 Tax=Clostridium brassicae TaxID=2999072 RepID=A0ABT4DDG6_9CLOT|nr:septum formation initiator family protein [Clostridium brassicae]MCY6960337.1 septum formation initiator family protein [Clostridium brassicae]
MRKKFKFKNILICCILIYIGYTLVSQQVTIRNKKVQLEKLNIELKEATKENQSLLDKTKMSKTYRYVEKLARERLDYIKQGENAVMQKKD